MNLRLPFFIFTGIVVLNFVLCLFFIPETRRSTNQTSAKKVPYLKQLIQIARQHAQLLATAGLGQVCVQTLRRGCNIIIPLYADEVVGLTTQQVRWVVMISSAVDMSMFPIAGYMMDRIGRQIRDSTGGLHFRHWHGVDAVYGYIFMVTVRSNLHEDGQRYRFRDNDDARSRPRARLEGTGEFLGLWRLTGDFGGSAGPVIVGNLADLFGLSYSGFALGGIGYLAVGIFLWLVPETLQQEKSAKVRDFC